MAVEAKICGLTRPADAALAAALGADFLGVIFAGGPRTIDVKRAREIVNAAAGVPVFGVFGSQPLLTILDIMDQVGLAGAQLHAPAGCIEAAALRHRGWLAWRVIALGDDNGWLGEVESINSCVDAIVVEARAPGGAGGKGIPIAVDLVQSARAAVRRTRFVLAGGLVPDSVGEAIRMLRPDGVDVSSGVESGPGIKDRDRLTRFLENVRAADAAP